MTPAPSPTPQQSAILGAVTEGRRNLMIQAYAGTGKTSTLTMIDAATAGPALLICFNKAVAVEAERHVRSTTQVRTFNSIGHRIWAASSAHKVTLAPTKTLDIFRWLVEMEPPRERSEMWREYDTVVEAVSLAKALGYIPVEHAKAERRLCTKAELCRRLDSHLSDLALTILDRILMESIRQAYQGCLDFNDQPYMAALFGGIYPRFPLVLIDEYQDVSPVNREMIRKLTKSARQIGVGDEAQAIYAFRGADAASMDRAITDFDMQVLPLSVSFRCPSKIVSNVHWRVPNFRSSREGGSVTQGGVFHPGPNAAVLCRNNAPLVALAMKLAHSGYTVNVGGVDIAKRLLKVMTKLGPGSMSRTQSIDALDLWHQRQPPSDSADDLADTIRVFLSRGSTLDSAMAYAKHLFEQHGSISFFTGHKAKGLEWPEVYHLDPGLLHESDQDPNLRYVIDTRSSDRLTYIKSKEDA